MAKMSFKGINHTPRSQNEGGNVLFYVLIAVALMAALTYSVTKGSGDSVAGSGASRIFETTRSQAQLIRAAISECVLLYNFGYPAQPAAPARVSDLECQIADTPTVVRQKIFGGAQNRFLPQPPAPFTAGWTYNINTTTTPNTISILLTQAMNCTADVGVQSALRMLVRDYSTDEADVTCNGSTAQFRLYIVRPNT